MKKFTFCLVAFTAFLSLTLFQGCPFKKGMDKSDWWTGFYTTKNAKKTPRGATVYSYENVTPANLEKVDDGLARVFDIASRVYGYKNGLNYSDYRIILFKRSKLCTTAAGFAVNAPDYDGTEYDKDPRPGFGVVCAAGLSAEFESPLAVIVQDDPTILLATRFEGEHLILYVNDRWKWQETLFHGNGSGHPILPDTDGSLVAEQSLSDAGLAEVSKELTTDISLADSDLIIKKGTKVCILIAK